MPAQMEWWLWMAAGLVLLLVELMTPGGFVVMFFGLGALTVGLVARLDLAGPAWFHWLLFATLSLGYLLVFRGRLQRHMLSSSRAEMDSLVGTIAITQERLLPGAVGRVEARGSAWSARNMTAKPIEPGQRCRVLRVEGLMLSIQPE